MAKNKSKKPFYKRWWFILLVVILIVVAFSSGEDSEQAAEPNSEPTESSEPAESTEETTKTREDMTLDEFLEFAVIEVMGEETPEGKPTFVEIEEKLNSMRLIYTRTGDYSSSSSMLSDATEFFEIISQDSEVMELEDVEIGFKMILVDKYGNEEESTVMVVGVSTETLSKINWDNFLSSNLPGVAYRYSTHPAIE